MKDFPSYSNPVIYKHNFKGRKLSAENDTVNALNFLFVPVVFFKVVLHFFQDGIIDRNYNGLVNGWWNVSLCLSLIQKAGFSCDSSFDSVPLTT